MVRAIFLTFPWGVVFFIPFHGIWAQWSKTIFFLSFHGAKWLTLSFNVIYLFMT